MAKISFEGMDDLAEVLEREAERAKLHGEAAIIAGAEVAKAAMKERVAVSEYRNGGHRGHLKDHIKIDKVQYTTEDGYSTEIYPSGKRDDGQRYATVGFVLEYGRSNMKARPWMNPAVEAAKQDIQEAMIKELFSDADT